VTRYTDDSRDRVRDAIDMVAVVSKRVELRRAGANSYFGNCPFHDERTGSFHVSPDEKLYHCFGCEASGDAFKFVMETEGLHFTEALESLGGMFGVPLVAEDEDPAAAARRERRARLYALTGRAAVYYARYLWEAREATNILSHALGA
jgi:DNA primase